jgi:hypothetical protein
MVDLTAHLFRILKTELLAELGAVIIQREVGFVLKFIKGDLAPGDTLFGIFLYAKSYKR